MRSVKSSVRGWTTPGRCLAFLIVLQALGLGACSTQGPVQPRFDEEIAKQEKIYRSKGAEVPSGYVISRGLSDYAELLPSGFCDTLGRLRSSDRWLDIGAGEGQAILDYYEPEDASAPAGNCARPRGQVSAVAMSIEDRRTSKWKQQADNLGDSHIRYLFGKSLRNYSYEELGKFQIITDVYGGFSYTQDLSLFMEKVLSLLETGGVFYTLVQSVHLENAKDKPSTWYLTNLVDPAGRDVKVCSWLKKTTCVKVTCDSKSEWETPTELISIRKVCSDVTVPRTQLLKFEAGNPPGRRFQLER